MNIIHVPGHPSIAAHDFLADSQPSSPVKSSVMSSRRPGQSLLSSASQATSNEGRPASPSTRASSVGEDVTPDGEDSKPPTIPVTEPPFTHANRSEDFSFLKSDPSADFVGSRKAGTVSVYGADVLAMAAAASPGKNSVTSQITANGAGDDGRFYFDDRHGLRPSRSQSRLRGLRFWKKKPRPGEVDFEPTP